MQVCFILASCLFFYIKLYYQGSSEMDVPMNNKRKTTEINKKTNNVMAVNIEENCSELKADLSHEEILKFLTENRIEFIYTISEQNLIITLPLNNKSKKNTLKDQPSTPTDYLHSQNYKSSTPSLNSRRESESIGSYPPYPYPLLNSQFTYTGLPSTSQNCQTLQSQIPNFQFHDDFFRRTWPPRFL